MAEWQHKINVSFADYEIIANTATRLDTYSPSILPLHVRTPGYDKWLTRGAVVLEGEQQFDPDDDTHVRQGMNRTDAAEFSIRDAQRQRQRDRIADGSLVVRSLISPGEVDALGVQGRIGQEQIISLQNDIHAGYQLGIVAGPQFDRRPVSTGGFQVVEFADRSSQLLQSSRRGDIVLADERDDPYRIVERARLAFEQAWAQSLADPEAVMHYLS